MNCLDQWLGPIVLQSTILLAGAQLSMRWLRLDPLIKYAIGLTAILGCLALPRLTAQERPASAAPKAPSPAIQTASGENKSAAFDDRPRKVSGQVQDHLGQPVADCFLYGSRRTSSGAFEELSTSTDANGRYSLQFPGNLPEWDAGYVWAIKPGYGVRVVAFAWQLKSRYVWDEATITLPKMAPIEVHVVSTAGKPVANAVIEPHWFHLPNGAFSADQNQGLSGGAPRQIVERLRVSTDANGYAKLTSYNPKTLSRLAVTSEESGTQVVEFRNDQELTVKLQPVGIAQGQLVGENLTEFAGAKFLLTTDYRFSPGDPSIPHQGIAEVSVDENGQFQSPPLAAGSLSVTVPEWEKKHIAVPKIPEGLTVNSGQTEQVKIELVKSVELTGRIVKDDDNAPVRGATVIVRSNSVLLRDVATTDNNGYFRMFAAPGKNSLSLMTLGPDTVRAYTFPKPNLFVVDIQADATSRETTAIRLPRLPEVTIHLVDSNDKPLSRQKILIGMQVRRDRFFGEVVETDEAGIVKLPLSYEFDLGREASPYQFYFSDEVNHDNPPAGKQLKVTRESSKVIRLKKT